MTNRTLFRRTISSVCRRIERYVVTVYQNNELRYFGDPEINLDSVARRMTADEFLNAAFANAGQMRIDAVTVPSYPMEDFDEFLTALLPGCASASLFSGQSTPYAMFQKYEECWHRALQECGIQSDQEALLYLRSGSLQTYEAPPQRTVPGHSLTMTVTREMPVAGVFNTAILSSANNSTRYANDTLWMSRALIELLPVPLYQCLQLGDKISRYRIPLNVNHTCYAPLSSDIDVAARLYGVELRALEQAIVANTSKTPLAYRLDPMDGIARVDSFTWSSANAIRLSDGFRGSIADLINADVAVIENDALVFQDNATDSLLLGDSPMPVQQHFVDLHNGDAVADILKDVWETEPELFGTED